MPDWQGGVVGRRRSEQDRDLQRVWEQVPAVACQGLCTSSCGPIDASAREKQRLRERGIRLVSREQALQELAETGEFRCPALTEQDRCSVYADRPTVCRLWGVMESLRCPHGCVPDGGLLDDAVGLALLAQSLQAGSPSGTDGGSGGGGLLAPDQVKRLMRKPTVRAAVQQPVARPGPPAPPAHERSRRGVGRGA